MKYRNVRILPRARVKPFEAYTRIEALLDGPYLELFARLQYSGWTALGNEIDGLDIRDALVAQLELFGGGE